MKNKRPGKRALVFLCSGMALVALLTFGLHPYLAITAPVGGEVAVVEGWIPEWMMPAVKEEIDKRGYTRIHTTGTLRPFTYYLYNGDGIAVRTREPIQGEVRINVSGLPQAGFLLIAGGDTLLAMQVGPHSQRYHTHLPVPVDSFVIRSTNAGHPPEDLYNIFVKYFTVGGSNIHQLASGTRLLRADGTAEPGWPTFAHSSAAFLEREGIPAGHLHIVPAAEGIERRTLANAVGFAKHAREKGIDRVDVISLGVHARRSRKMYRKACGKDVMVGVIAVPDPEVPRRSWWRRPVGWYRMVKEIIGVPASSLFEVEEQ
jgi:uncharacterized SAM-binding protein YcdF (DUF218 family)